ncbi:Transposase [Brevibacterium sp. Mu109]|uniref:IS1182 family transposase n=1 Tax=Brevibacterium sp. Mu109 TaxID=1255669 RepID=UPI000C5A06EC|nr:IS1182 family transposase [Brevibacterium sp. Mu109]SMX77791.1 Transposase [Brevibacterium sp. Mu109]
MSTSGEELFTLDAQSPDSRPRQSPAGEAKRFREYDQSQQFLLPPSLDDWLAVDDEARFISEIVDDVLDLTDIYASYEKLRGAPPYDPAMMLKVLLYAYSTGITSSRKIERACQRDIAFRWLSGNQTPDYRSLARFRKRHLDAFGAVFTQVLAVCAQAGMVKLGRVALDGTKLHADASKHKAMSYDRMDAKLHALQAEVEALVADAERTDDAEDAQYGEDQRGDEIPAELKDRTRRIAKLQAAKADLEADAQAKAGQKARDKAATAQKSPAEQEQAAEDAADQAVPEPRAQRNFTDPEARMMKTNHGFDYAYNGQAIVDDTSQVIIATDLGQQATDVQQLIPMHETMTDQLRQSGIEEDPAVFLADAGYCSKANLAAADQWPATALIATGRELKGETFTTAQDPLPEKATARETMAHRLRQPDGHEHYARRKAIVEPVFGQIKTRQRAGQLRLRGLAAANGEWVLHALCHNLRKLRLGSVFQAGKGAVTPA